jgi:hypothetical protein
MFSRLSFIAIVAAAVLGCSGGTSNPDAANAPDTGTNSVDSGTTPPDAGVDSGTIPPDAGVDSGTASTDAGPCSSVLGSCNPCAGDLGNDAGIGAYCTKGGNQCGSGLNCAADNPFAGPAPNTCVLVVSFTGNVCTDGGTPCPGAGVCCQVQSPGGGLTVSVCVPTGCGGC